MLPFCSQHITIFFLCTIFCSKIKFERIRFPSWSLCTFFLLQKEVSPVQVSVGESGVWGITPSNEVFPPLILYHLNACWLVEFFAWPITAEDTFGAPPLQWGISATGYFDSIIGPIFDEYQSFSFFGPCLSFQRWCKDSTKINIF